MTNYPMTSLLKSIMDQIQHSANSWKKIEDSGDSQALEEFAKQHLDYLKQILVQEVN